MLTKVNFKTKMETENHCKNGANLKSHTSRGIFIVQMFVVLCLLFAGCSKDKNDDGDDGGGGGSSSATELNEAVYFLKYAINVSTDYNDKKLKPSSVAGVATVEYQPNGLLDYMEFPNNGKKVIVPFHTDMGRRPSTICKLDNRDYAVTYSTLKNGNYDFNKNSANLLACFLDFGANSANLNNFSIPTGAPAAALSAMITQKNSYKMLVYGKNKEGKLICKYIGYVEGSQYHYWDTDPDSPAHGKSGSKSF